MVKFSGLDWSCGPRQCFWTLHYREWRSAWRARELGCNEGNGLAGGMLWSLSYITFTPVQHSATMCNLDMSNSSFKIHSVTSIRFGCCKMASYWLDAWMFKKSCILHQMMTNDKWWLFTKLEPHPKEIKRCETFKPAKTLKICQNARITAKFKWSQATIQRLQTTACAWLWLPTDMWRRCLNLWRNLSFWSKFLQLTKEWFWGWWSRWVGVSVGGLPVQKNQIDESVSCFAYRCWSRSR